ncbi:MAG: hypothetical protein ABUL60_05755 [Myxococcales bacterium]
MALASLLGCSAGASDDDASAAQGSQEELKVSPCKGPACTPKGPACGGIAGIACPGDGKCADDPSDSCDPKAGGADCIGICSCVDNVLCVKGSHFDGDPNVCQCVSDAPACVQKVLCVRGSHFDSDPKVCRCVPDARACVQKVLCIRGSHFDSDPTVCRCVPDAR